MGATIINIVNLARVSQTYLQKALFNKIKMAMFHSNKTSQKLLLESLKMCPPKFPNFFHII